jgi:hypothetical protein
MHAAIAEVVDDFVQRHGVGKLPAFLDRLATRLDERQNSAAAALVRHLERFGFLPPLDESDGSARDGSRRNSKANSSTTAAKALKAGVKR